jgi:lipopolysaccharide assembly protein A
MTRFVRLLLGLVALIVIMIFAIANRTPVEVSLAPFPVMVELPVYGVFLLGMVIGALLGGLGVWISSLRKGREARRMRNRAWALENQLNVAKRREERAEAERYGTPRTPTVQGAGS